MPDQHIAPDLSRSGIRVADGYGIRIYVRHRHLIVEDGYGSHRRKTRLHRATHGLERIIVLGHTGYLTFEALRWIQDAGLALIQIDGDGRIVAASAPGPDHPALRRAQARAADNDTGLAITRSILRAKFEGHATVARRLDADAADLIAGHVDQLDDAPTQDSLRLVEAQAAAVYWDLLAQVPVRWAKRQQIPDHWNQVGPRRSPITGKSRRAANPIHATLNYLYALAEAEARIACLTVGLDPGIGILHTDQPTRDSMALDIIEAVRPDIEAYVLDLITDRTLSRDDFHETRRGGCRILRPLTHELAATTRTWAQRLAPVVEETARTLRPGGRQLRGAATPLTQTRRRQAHSSRHPDSGPASGSATPKERCSECGRRLVGRNGCRDCNDRHLRDPDHPRLARLAELRLIGDDPAHGGEAAAKRGSKTAAELRRSHEWDAVNERPDPAEFTETILPQLDDFTAADLARATGLSAGYCSMIKRGLRVPHPRHWPALAAADGTS